MNDILDIEIILKKQNYHYIYNTGTILLIILLIFIYISCIYNYQTYYISKGTIKNDNMELLINIDDLKYITTNNIINIEHKNYHYQVVTISDELYIDESLQNYKYVYLKINNLNSINNYVYEIKLKKENKKIIQYLKDYL